MGPSKQDDGKEEAVPEMDAASAQGMNRLADALVILAHSVRALARAYEARPVDDVEDDEQAPHTDMAGRRI
jgi:hypothetical protein